MLIQIRVELTLIRPVNVVFFPAQTEAHQIVQQSDRTGLQNSTKQTDNDIPRKTLWMKINTLKLMFASVNPGFL